jgi:hypothetical protein
MDFFRICFHFMICKRYHVHWRFSSGVFSFGMYYVCEVRVLPPVKTVKINSVYLIPLLLWQLLIKEGYLSNCKMIIFYMLSDS